MEIKRIKSVSEGLIKELSSVFKAGSDDGKSEEWNLENTRNFLTNPDNIFLLAYEGAEIVGMATAYKLQRMDKRGSEIFFYEIGVSKKSRGKGIGKAIIERLKEIRNEMKADEMFVLTKRSNNPATNLYRSTGGKESIENDEIMFNFKLS